MNIQAAQTSARIAILSASRPASLSSSASDAARDAMMRRVAGLVTGRNDAKIGMDEIVPSTVSPNARILKPVSAYQRLHQPIIDKARKLAISVKRSLDANGAGYEADIALATLNEIASMTEALRNSHLTAETKELHADVLLLAQKASAAIERSRLTRANVADDDPSSNLPKSDWFEAIARDSREAEKKKNEIERAKQEADAAFAHGMRVANAKRKSERYARMIADSLLDDSKRLGLTVAEVVKKRQADARALRSAEKAAEAAAAAEKLAAREAEEAEQMAAQKRRDGAAAAAKAAEEEAAAAAARLAAEAIQPSGAGNRLQFDLFGAAAVTDFPKRSAARMAKRAKRARGFSAVSSDCGQLEFPWMAAFGTASSPTVSLH